MKILAHRGYWLTEAEKNTSEALRRALENGFGFESDIRDYKGRLVISHNMADETCLEAERVFRWLSDEGDRHCFAINIKSDGLKELLAALLKKYGIANYFAFDMSVPQMVEYAEMGITCYTRQSEMEQMPVMYENALGVWIDGFWNTDWITQDLLQGHIANEKKVCIVSPELHQREYLAFWKRLKSFDLDQTKVFLCTDKPREAAEFFENEAEK